MVGRPGGACCVPRTTNGGRINRSRHMVNETTTLRHKGGSGYARDACLGRWRLWRRMGFIRTLDGWLVGGPIEARQS